MPTARWRRCERIWPGWQATFSTEPPKQCQPGRQPGPPEPPSASPAGNPAPEPPSASPAGNPAPEPPSASPAGKPAPEPPLAYGPVPPSRGLGRDPVAEPGQRQWVPVVDGHV